MPKLKLGTILDEKPVKLTIELPASVYRDLVAYAEVLSRTTGQTTDPAKLAPHMIARFIASDREFAKMRREVASRSHVEDAHSRTDAAHAIAHKQTHDASADGRAVAAPSSSEL
jgi:hypothetical protein